jgi:hypothetical protein
MTSALAPRLPAYAYEIWIKLDSAPPPLTTLAHSLPALRI